MNRLLAWLREHKNAVAAIVALVVVSRVARFALGSAWVLAGWDDVVGVGGWALERWPWWPPRWRPCSLPSS